MKIFKFIIVLFFIFVSYNINAYSTENRNTYTKEINSDQIKKSYTRPIPIVTLGLQGGGEPVKKSL